MKFYLLLFLIFLNLSTNSTSEEKIVFLDVDYILSNSLKGKSLLKKLDEINKNNISKLEAKEKILKDNENTIKLKKNVISEDELNKEINNLKKDILEFRKEKKKLVNEFNDLKKKEIANLMKLINPIISSYVEDKSIDIVLNKKDILIGKKSYDITQNVLKMIDQNIK